MSPKKCIFVLGMHRSGTSALTGVLSLLGADLGVNMVKATEANEKGFFENNSINVVHEKILASLGSAWDSPFPLPDGWWRANSLKIYKDDLKEIIQKEFRGALMAIKDPRLCRLLPLWKEIMTELQIDYCAIFPLRNPLEVARSLQKRDGFSMEKSSILWTIHNFEAELYSRDCSRVFLAFDELLKNPQSIITNFTTRLNLKFPKQLPEALPEIQNFLEPNLKHHHLQTKSIDQGLLNDITEWYQLLLGLTAKTKIEAEELQRIDALRNNFMRVYRFFYNTDLIEQERIFQKQERLLQEKDYIIADKNVWLTEKERQIQEKNLWLAEKDRLLAARDQQINSLLNSTSWRVTAPFRKGMALIKKILKLLVRAMKKVFHLLPISITKKQEIKHLFYKVCRPVIKGTQAYQNYLQDEELAVACAIPEPVKNIYYSKKQIWENLNQETLKFHPPSKVKVSIIIPVFNQYVYTYNCLKSIYDNTGSLDYEIIVVDDHSEDRTWEMLSRIKGIRVFRNETNCGFIESCNFGAKQASGDYLVFLNNDTMVMSNWLNWLLKTFEIFPDAGLVGAKLIFPNGRLQEAGGIIWKDGSACNYARLEDPARPENNYLREVDYCSGACIMIPRELFFSVGLFDKHYAPAYYEDVDLAFKVRAAGKKVFYQPQAAITHFEGITSGTDTSKGIKQYQVINREKFYKRWQDQLASHAENGINIETEKERHVKKRMLIIDECVCMPDQDAGSLRMFNLIQIFQELGYKITFFPNNLFYPQTYVSNMQGRGIEVLVNSYFRTIEKYLNAKGKIFDVVLLSRLNVAKKYIDLALKYCPQAKVIFDTVDLHFLRERREAELKGSDLMFRAAEETKRLELGIASKSDITFVVSYVEKEIIHKERPELIVKVVPTIQAIYGCKNPFQNRSGIIFIGGFKHTPNVDAMLYFVYEILPLIRGRIPDLKTYIIGTNPPEEIKSLASPDVIVTGYVPDVETYFNRCRLSIAPLRWGAGVKGKINLSMSYGLPVVATPVAVEGMFLRDGEDVLTGAGAREFAKAVIRLYNDETLWNKLSAAGIENIKKYFSFEAVKESVQEILNVNESKVKDSRRVTVGQ